MRLDKFLCDIQLGSRNQVKEYIKKGTVSVNDIVIKNPDFKLDEKKDIVTYLGKVLAYQNVYYYMLHKPAGVVTATKDKHEQTVMDLLRNASGKGLFPVGRLDKDTEGLLLITNDGELAHNLLSPKKHVAKTYYVECRGSINEHKIRNLEEGVDIGDENLTLPSMVELLSQTDNSYTMKLTITEGRYHQVKRMIEAIDGSVTYLKRLSMGPLLLDEKLPKGAYRPLTDEEIIELTLTTTNRGGR